MNKMETSNLLDLEFKTLVIRKLNELSENLNIIKIKKKIQSKVKDTLTEMKNHLQGFYKWMESRIRSMIWNIWMQNTPHQNSKEEKRVQKNEDSVRRLWDDFKHTNNTLWGCWKKREHEFENLFEKMTENFPNLVTYKSRKYR